MSFLCCMVKIKFCFCFFLQNPINILQNEQDTLTLNYHKVETVHVSAVLLVRWEGSSVQVSECPLEGSVGTYNSSCSLYLRLKVKGCLSLCCHV